MAQTISFSFLPPFTHVLGPGNGNDQSPSAESVRFGVMSFNFLSAFSKQWLSYHRPIVQAFLELHPTDDMIIMRIEEKATNDNILRFVLSIAGV